LGKLNHPDYTRCCFLHHGCSAPCAHRVSRFTSEESREGTPDTSGVLASPFRRITSPG
jgi:hypothetical protein